LNWKTGNLREQEDSEDAHAKWRGLFLSFPGIPVPPVRRIEFHAI